MGQKKIRVRIVGSDAHTAYIALSGYRPEPGVVAKTVRLDMLLDSYKGPLITIDFDKDGTAIGVEIIT